jgi:hypothetical protein
MSEPVKENPKTPKRSKRRPAMEPLGWDEIVSQPGMGGYLSFLNGPVPLPHLDRSATALASDPGVVSHSGILGVHTEPEIVPDPVIVSTPRIDIASDVVSKTELASDSETDRSGMIPEVLLDPVVVSTPRPTISPGPEVVSIPAITFGQRLRIRRCAATHDGHSLGEEVLYQALWKSASRESAETRTIVIGWRGMSQLCRMTPKNCKINTQRLIRKLALEILSPYNTPESIGTTYRIYSDLAILQRRREAGLEWVVRSRGVEFVDPATGVSILPICAHTYRASPSQ